MDFKRYDKINFKKNEYYSKRITALFLLYDKESAHLHHFEKLELIDHYIQTLIHSEEYEAAEAFINRRKRKIKKYKKDNRNWSFKLIFRFLKYKLL